MLNKIRQTVAQKRVIRYVISGIASFLTENATFSLVYYIIGTNARVANVFSILVALVVNFILNKYYVFTTADDTGRKPAQLIQYLVLIALNLAISTYLIGVLVDMGVPGFISKIFTSTLIITWTYIIYKKIIFRDKVN